MPTHSIWASSPPPGTFIVGDDGQTIWVGNTFYTYGAGVTGWRCAGGRVYIPAGLVASLPSTLTIGVWNGVKGNSANAYVNNLDTAPLQSKVATVPAGGGWVEVFWDSPVTMTAGSLAMIGYTFGTTGSPGTKYMTAPSPSNSFVQASDGSTLVLTDKSNAGPGLERTYFKYGSSAVTYLVAGGIWGVDIIVDEGTSTPMVTAAFTGAGALTASSKEVEVRTAGFSGAGALSAAVEVVGGIPEATAAFNGNGTLSAAIFPIHNVAANFTGSGTLSAVVPSVGISIADENAKTGAPSTEWEITGIGDTSNLGFPREFSTNTGDTVEFSCHGTGTVLDIYRIGWYGGAGWHKVTGLTNTATSQPNPNSIPNSNGGINCSNWSVTAHWDVPDGATPGLYVGVYRNGAGNNASYIPFVVRDDSRDADIIIKTSDTTWALAYNYYGTPGAPTTGKSLYGSGGPLGDITTRAQAVSYHRPVVTRGGVPQTYWLNAEAPMIRWAERMGYNVKYVASCDLERDASCLNGAQILISSGHDEYWSDGMREAVEDFRDAGGHVLFQSGNEVFWRTRFTDSHTMVCYKDTQGGPGSHVGGVPVDPVTWTGSWSDTRWADRKPANTLNGQYFRMNGVNNKTATFDHTAGYAAHVAWRNTGLASGTDFSVPALIGFEADEYHPTNPNSVRLSETFFNIDDNYADDNGEFYTGDGDLDWGISSQRHLSGSVILGFGTCQWSWGLDATHDRGIDVSKLDIQQFEYNVLRDLGAAPETPHSGIVTSSPETLDHYGIPLTDVTAHFTGAGSLTATAFPVALANAGFGGSGTVTAGVLEVEIRTAGFSGAGSLTALVSSSYDLTAAFGGSGSLAAAVVPVEFRAADFSGSGSFTALASSGYDLTAAFGGAGTLTAETSTVEYRTAGFSGSGTLAADVSAGFERVAAFGGSGSLAALTRVVEYRNAQFAGAGALTAAVTKVEIRVAGFSGSGHLFASVTSGDTISATMVINGVEVPVTLTIVSGGVEVPITIG